MNFNLLYKKILGTLLSSSVQLALTYL